MSQDYGEQLSNLIHSSDIITGLYCMIDECFLYLTPTCYSFLTLRMNLHFKVQYMIMGLVAANVEFNWESEKNK